MPKEWSKEAGVRLEGSRPLDSAKVQTPCIVRTSSGGFRLFYTAVGPAKPFPTCQGYILSATADDGVSFRTEPGIRVAPQPALPHMSLRVLAPTVIRCAEGHWRMYFESRGPAALPTVICSAVSSDMLHWEYEPGIRLGRCAQTTSGLNGSTSFGGPRYVQLADGRSRLYCCETEFGPGGPEHGERLSKGVVSALTSDGLRFKFEPGYRVRDKQTEYDTLGISAAEVIPPLDCDQNWTMLYSAWQDVPPGTAPPVHPSQDCDAVKNGRSEDFAATSIASDMAGYRSRIFVAHSSDGISWSRAECVVAGEGYGGEGVDAVHAEDMSVIHINDGKYRMYYAACDKNGSWRIASAISELSH